jgi:NAD(P)-dependent dehydrogenase (short-subunit alcohol dehydrogenase family)
MPSLNNQRVLVVGGSSGIGFAVAQSAILAGAEVTIASRSAEKLTAASQSLGTVSSAIIDTADEIGIEAFFQENDPWDHIVISAAQTPSGPVRKLPLDDAKQAMESKFWGAYRVARAALLSVRDRSPSFRASSANVHLRRRSFRARSTPPSSPLAVA